VVEPHKPRGPHDPGGVIVNDVSTDEPVGRAGGEGELEGEPGGEEEDGQRPRAIPWAPQ